MLTKVINNDSTLCQKKSSEISEQISSEESSFFFQRNPERELTESINSLAVMNVSNNSQSSCRNITSKLEELIEKVKHFHQNNLYEVVYIMVVRLLKTPFQYWIFFAIISQMKFKPKKTSL